MTFAKYVIPIFIASSSLSATTSDWANAAGGVWNVSTPANWLPAAVPIAVDDVAKFLDVIIAPRTVSLTQPVTVGTASFNNANAYTIASNTLNFQTSSGNALISIPALAGGHIISSAVTLSSNLTIDHNVASTFTLSGVLSGAGTITKTGNNGQVFFTGAAANTYTGLTTINTTLDTAGITLAAAGVPAMPGNALISFGTLKMGAIDQIGNSSTVTIGDADGTFDLDTFDQTIGQLIYQAGKFTTGGGTLTLTSNTTALTVRNVEITPDLVFTGLGDIVFDATNNGTAVLSGKVALGALTHNFNIANETAAIDMNISGVISGEGGGITKIGAGRLEFSGGASNTYTGFTSVLEGTLSLNRAGVTSIAGNVFIDGGTLTLLKDNQINNDFDILLKSGTFDMGAFNETINAFDFIGGVINTTSTLTLTSSTVALQMRGGTSLTGGTVSLTGAGDVVFDPAVNGTATIGTLNLGGDVHEFDIGNGTAAIDMNITGVISGAGGVTKIGEGSLQFNGSAPNIYEGLTTVNSGELIFAMSAGNDAAGGDITINGGSLSTSFADQFSPGTTMTVNGGSFLLNGNDQTLGVLNYLGGSVSQDGGILTLGANPLTMRNTSLNGPIILLAGGTVTFDATNNGTATIGGTLGFSGSIPTFDINNGTAVEDMIISSVISNGGLIKDGAGTLVLLGANTYSGGTTVSAGVLQGNTNSLQGPIITITAGTLVFDQLFDGTFAGTLNGGGTLIKQGSGTLTFSTPQVVNGPTTVAGGTLIVNSTFGASGSLNINGGATLGGVGTITKDVTVSGTLSPGDGGIGTINLIGTQILTSGSTLDVELTPTINDFVNVTESITIQPNSTFVFSPQSALYVEPLNYAVVQTTTGVTGVFDHISDPFPLFFGALSYDANNVFFQISLLPVSSLQGLSKNAEKVARCLDERDPPAGSDLYNVINSLRFVTTVESIEKSLLDMQPSLFTSLSVVKQASTLYLRNALFNRLEVRTRSCMEEKDGYHFWVAPLIGVSEENSHEKEPGYNALTPGVAIGMDGFLFPEFQIGGSVGYTNSDINWKKKRGDGRIQGVYGALFGRLGSQVGFLEAAAILGYDYYSTQREIRVGGFLPFSRHAKANHHGFEASGHLKGAFQFSVNQTHLGPFISLDYLYQHEGSFDEHGADSLNLDLSSKNSNFIQSEVGMDFAHCFHLMKKTITPYVQFGGLWEKRFNGGREWSSFGGCTLNVDGYYPSRFLVAAGGGFTVKWALQTAPRATFNYKGKYGLGYQDHSFNLELIY